MSSDNTGAGKGRGRHRGSIGMLALGALAAVLAVALIAVLVRDRAPGDDSAEAGFLRDMMVHHDQAVEMALTIRDRTGDDQLRAMATDIILSQQGQVGMMDGWLQVWDLSPNRDGPAMAWMDHPVEGPMPGMATTEEIGQLRTLPVDEAEVLFLQLMIRHHQGAVDMAGAYLDRGDHDDVTAFAEGVIRVQDTEIETMNRMLEQRGAGAAGESDTHATPGASPASGHEGH